MELISNLSKLIDNGLTIEESLSELTRQYKWNIRQLNLKNIELYWKSKLSILFVILFIFTCLTLFIGSFYLFKNMYLCFFISLITFFGNVYVYTIFSSYYLKELKATITYYEEKIENLCIEINTALSYLDIEIDDYYSKI